MDLIPSDEEAQLQETVRRFAQDHATVHSGDMAARYDAAWRAFARLGGTGMAIGEDQGGFGVSPEGVALTAFELGAMPVALPRIEQVVVIAGLLAAARGAPAAALRDRFVSGAAHVVLADWEGGGQHGFAPPAAVAEHRQGGIRLCGVKAAVIGAAGADLALVTARFEGMRGLFAVRLEGAGSTLTPHRLADLTPVAELVMDGAVAEGGALLHGAALDAAWDRARDDAIVMAAAASSGSMAAAIRLTVGYLKIRRQFGIPLAEFQALQQRVADLFIVANEARSSVYSALAALYLPAAERRRAVSGCKVKVARAARYVTGEVIHLHGGIGFTTEYAVGHHHRRALVDEKLFGDLDFHMSRYLDARSSGEAVWPVDYPLSPPAPLAQSGVTR